MRSSTSSSDTQSLSLAGGTSVWAMHIPLVLDLLRQQVQVRVFLIKLSIFVMIFIAIDRLGTAFLTRGLDRAYGLETPAEVLCIGHSHTALGLDEIALERGLGVPVGKYARNGANLNDRFTMIRHYLERQPSSVKILVYDVDAHIFTADGLSLNSYSLFYPFMDSPSVDAYIRQFASWVDYHTRHMLKLRRFNLETCNSSLRGWLHVYANLKQGTVDVQRLQKEIAAGQIRRISFDEDCIRRLDETLRFVLEKGVHVVLLYIPTIDLYNQAEPKQHARAIQHLREFQTKYEGVTFLDYTAPFAHRHELFYDPIHLNPQGQRLVTEQLVQDLLPLLAQDANCPGRRGEDMP